MGGERGGDDLDPHILYEGKVTCRLMEGMMGLFSWKNFYICDFDGQSLRLVVYSMPSNRDSDP